MRRALLAVALAAFFFSFSVYAFAQSNNQTIPNGGITTAVNFTGANCNYSWTNSDPSIGLPASGTGNIPAFTAVNNNNHPITATITATPTDANFAYIPNADGKVSVINTATNLVTAQIPVGSEPWGVSASQDGKKVYVSNSGSNSVSVINTATNTVTATVTVGSSPHGIAVTPDGSRVYVANTGPSYFSTSGPNSVSVINTANNTVVKTIKVGIDPIGVVVSPDGSRVYVLNVYSNTITVINTATNTVITTIAAGTQSWGIAINPNGHFVYVACPGSNTVSVINTSTNNVTASIPVSGSPNGITVSHDGNRLYVTNAASSMLTIINAADNTVIGSVGADSSPCGVSVTPDDKQIYVADYNSNNIVVIDAVTNTRTATIPDGSYSYAMGNFISLGPGCNSSPVSFTITVNPSSSGAVINTSNATGAITACAGTASASPNIQQFNVSGNNLTADVTVNAPAGFEVSLTAIGGYGGSVSLAEAGGTLNNTTIYVRSAVGDAAGNVSGNVILSSAGAPTQQVAVSGVVNALPVVNPVNSQSATNGATTIAINFTGSADIYNWTNDTPDIGLAASGTGNIPSFTAVNNNNGPIISTITVTPKNSTGCAGTPESFTITVGSAATSILSAQSTLTGLTTVYGAVSQGESFHISGTNLTAGILVTAPAGFEVSNDGINYGATTLMSGTGNALNIKIFIRLASTTPVGNYSGNIVLSAPNAVSINVAMPLSTVTPAPLTVTANDKSKAYGAANPPFTVTYSGFVNNEGIAQLITPPNATTTATALSAPGQYPITASGAVAANYSFTYIGGVLTIVSSSAVTPTLIIPNAFTPNGDGKNDTWDIINLGNYTQSTVNVFSRWGQKVFSAIGYPTPWNGTYKGTVLPAGTYYYVVDPKNGQPIFTGWLVIIR
ncbi:gliding motility-associated C-terminal domain-containing protein [Mucilaginibacter sp.]|uniref:T9SS type B sorting domain-containing protein n=1 Tax=Mucilaginibacter sp. TaxID=1882438 RepID=UPI002ED589FA